MQKITYLLIFIFIVINTFAQKKDQIIDQIIAVVGNNIILESDIENQYLQLLSQGYTTTGDLKCQILEEFLYQKILIGKTKIL